MPHPPFGQVGAIIACELFGVIAGATAGSTGGESGIRTHVRVSPKHAFQACAFSHSAISPAGQSLRDLSENRLPSLEISLLPGLRKSSNPN